MDDISRTRAAPRPPLFDDDGRQIDDHACPDYCHQCESRGLDENNWCEVCEPEDHAATVAARPVAPKPPAAPQKPGKIGTGMGVTDKAERKRYMKWWRQISKTTRAGMKQGMSREVARIRAKEMHGDRPAERGDDDQVH